MPDTGAMVALLDRLSMQVAQLTSDVAILNDRRADNAAQDERHAALQTRVGTLERDMIARDARAKVIIAIIGGLGAIGGAALTKLLTLAGV
jgi:hypothetical protein